jgi:hypothetical protein
VGKRNDYGAALVGRPGCALKSCPKFNVERYLQQLRQLLPFVPPMPSETLKALHRARDYEGMVLLIRRAMNVQAKLHVAWVTGGEGDAPAWVVMPEKMPFYGTKEFRDLTIQMYFRKSFLQTSGYDQIAIAVAHELSHIVLDSMNHPLRTCEKAVDLTAMLLGFSGLYESGGHTEKRSGNTIRHAHLGYLTADELQTAYRLLTPGKLRLKTKGRRAVLAAAWRLAGVVVLAGIVAILAGAIKAESMWKLHQKLVTEQAKAQLPKPLNEYTTLIDVRVGLASLTNVYRVTKPKKEIDLSAFETNLRRGVCASDKLPMIRSGASYGFEYHWAGTNDVASFEIASCP